MLECVIDLHEAIIADREFFMLSGYSNVHADLNRALCDRPTPFPRVHHAGGSGCRYVLGEANMVGICRGRKAITCTRTGADATTQLPRRRRRRGGMTSGTSRPLTKFKLFLLSFLRDVRHRKLFVTMLLSLSNCTASAPTGQCY